MGVSVTGCFEGALLFARSEGDCVTGLDETGLFVGLCVVGLTLIGCLEGLDVVGLELTGCLEGLSVVGLLEGLDVGLAEGDSVTGCSDGR